MGHPLILDADDHRVGDRAFRDEADDVNGARSVDPGEDDCRALSIGGRMPEKDSQVVSRRTNGNSRIGSRLCKNPAEFSHKTDSSEFSRPHANSEDFQPPSCPALCRASTR